VLWYNRRRKTLDLGEVAPARCPSCRRDVVFQHHESRMHHRILLNPLPSKRASHVLLCPACGYEIDLPEEQAHTAHAMAGKHRQWEGGLMTDEAHARAASEFWDTLRRLEGYRGPRESDAAATVDQEHPEDTASGGWFPDPTGRHEQRFFDGTWWTAFVLDARATSSDAFLDPTAPGWYPDPHLRHELRYWDGRGWSDQTQDGGVVAVDPV
jgi:hypothetical protein